MTENVHAQCIGLCKLFTPECQAEVRKMAGQWLTPSSRVCALKTGASLQKWHWLETLSKPSVPAHKFIEHQTTRNHSFPTQTPLTLLVMVDLLRGPTSSHSSSSPASATPSLSSPSGLDMVEVLAARRAETISSCSLSKTQPRNSSASSWRP